MYSFLGFFESMHSAFSNNAVLQKYTVYMPKQFYFKQFILHKYAVQISKQFDFK